LVLRILVMFAGTSSRCLQRKGAIAVSRLEDVVVLPKSEAECPKDAGIVVHYED